jgi:hypothetical protein
MMPRWSCTFRCGVLGTSRYRAGVIEIEATDEQAARAVATAKLASKLHWLRPRVIETVTQVRGTNGD